MDGSYYERELARVLSDEGYHVVRSPASGSATSRQLPDLFWSIEGERPVAAELKCRKSHLAYFGEEEVASLEEFAAAFGAKPRLVGRFKGDTNYYITKPDDARRTMDSYAIDKTAISKTVMSDPR